MGCLVRVPIPVPKTTRIEPKTVDCAFIVYAQNSSAYRFRVIKSDNSVARRNDILEARDASFIEDIFPYKALPQVDPSNPPCGGSVRESDSEKEVEPICSKRARKEATFGPYFLIYLLERDLVTFKEAMSSMDAPY